LDSTSVIYRLWDGLLLSHKRSTEQYSHEFGIPMKLVRPIKMRLKETYGKVCISKNV